MDNQIIAAVQRVLTGAGSQVDINNVGEIRIFKANADGHGSRATATTSGSLATGRPSMACTAVQEGSVEQHWACSSRDNSAPAGVGSYPDSIGVSIEYDYQFITPLGLPDEARRRRDAAHDRPNRHGPQPNPPVR